LSLGQYSETFIDAAIDGEFLYDINDDDLKNTLGVEHRLHRKKILNCVYRLKIAETQRDSRLSMMLREEGNMNPPTLSPTDVESFTENVFPGDVASKGPKDDWRHQQGQG
jgi:hypothetical protein